MVLHLIDRSVSLVLLVIFVQVVRRNSFQPMRVLTKVDFVRKADIALLVPLRRSNVLLEPFSHRLAKARFLTALHALQDRTTQAQARLAALSVGHPHIPWVVLSLVVATGRIGLSKSSMVTASVSHVMFFTQKNSPFQKKTHPSTVSRLSTTGVQRIKVEAFWASVLRHPIRVHLSVFPQRAGLMLTQVPASARKSRMKILCVMRSAEISSAPCTLTKPSK
jgi:hypothetical protein